MRGLFRGRSRENQSESKNRKPYGVEHHGSDFKLLNAVARQIRVLKERVSELETQTSILKRDLSRVDRNQYRSVETKTRPRVPSNSKSKHEDPWEATEW